METPESLDKLSAEKMGESASKSRMRVNTTLEERAEWVRLWEESGKTPAEFCAELGFAESTFAVWRRQVRGGNPAEHLAFTEVPPAMVTAVLAANAGAGSPAVTIHLANGTRIETAVGIDIGWLRQLAAGLRS